MPDRHMDDQQFLLGLLALQNEFVSQPELLCAFAAWMADKSQRFDQLLIAQGALVEEDRQLLERLAERHLARFGGDLQQSIAQLPAAKQIREDLFRTAGDDQDAFKTIVSLISRHNEQGGLKPLEQSSIGQSNRFRILKEHARGGLGIVFLAEDESLHREVALKQIRDDRAAIVEYRAKFQHEAEVTGQLEHPGIVPVYAAGTDEQGRPYYAMKFIRGENFQSRIRAFHAERKANQTSLDGPVLRGLLRSFIDVCNAIDYAHFRGVLHRDLKPSNVMLGKHGETLVVDWGLAKQMRDAPQLDPLATLPVHSERPLKQSDSGTDSETRYGTFIGTPAYAPPEQMLGQLDCLGPASDVYSLGAILFELLTGEVALKGSTIDEVVEKSTTGKIPTPRAVERSVPRPLDAVCSKAMSLRPGDRYQTAGQLRQDVESWLADLPVTARRESLLDRTGRFSRRHRSWMIAAGLIAIIIMVSGFVTLQVSSNARQQNQLSEFRLRAEIERTKAQKLLALTNQMSSRRASSATGWPKKNRDVLPQAAVLADSPEMRLMLRNELANLECATTVQWERTLAADLEASQLAISLTGKRLARGKNTPHTAQVLIEILNPDSGIVERKLSFLPDVGLWFWKSRIDGIASLSYDSKDKFLFAGTKSGWIYQWSVPDYILVDWWHGHADSVNQILVNPESTAAWTCSSDATVKRWELEPRKLSAEFKHSSPVNSIAQIKVGLFIGGSRAAIVDEVSLKAFDVRPHGLDSFDTTCPTKFENALAIFQSNSIVIQSDWTVSAPQSQLVRSIDSLHMSPVRGIRIDPQFRLCVSYDADLVRVWDLASGTELTKLSPGSSIFDVEFHPTKPTLLVAAGTNLEEYAIAYPTVLQTQHASPFPIQATALQPSGDRLFSVSQVPGLEPKISQLTQSLLNSSVPLDRQQLSIEQIDYLECDSAAKHLFLVDKREGEIVTLDTSTKELRRLSGLVKPKLMAESIGSGICFFACEQPKAAGSLLSRQPYQIAQFDADRQVVQGIWVNDLSNVRLGRSDIYAIDVLDDQVAFTSHDNHLRILNGTTGKPVWVHDYKEAYSRGIAFGPLGASILCGDDLGQLLLFDPKSDQLISKIDGHRAAVSAVECNNTGLVVTVSEDRWLKLWQLRNSEIEAICEIGPFHQRFSQVSLSDDGQSCAVLLENSRAVHVLSIGSLLDKFRELKID